MIFLINEYNGGIINPNSLVYFYASWASNCNVHLDALKRIEQENPKLLILRLNTSKYPKFKELYKINKIPTFIIFSSGNLISRIDGYKDQYSLSKWVKKFIS